MLPNPDKLEVAGFDPNPPKPPNPPAPPNKDDDEVPNPPVPATPLDVPNIFVVVPVLPNVELPKPPNDEPKAEDPNAPVPPNDGGCPNPPEVPNPPKPPNVEVGVFTAPNPVVCGCCNVFPPLPPKEKAPPVFD